MGFQAAPAQLFYDFCLDEHVPADHLLRRIDNHLDLDSVRTQLNPYYSSTGRPSIDPELMMRMLIIGYSMGIRSERRLCEEVHLNLACRLFCRLGLDGKVPDHSSFSKNRHGRFRQSGGTCRRSFCSTGQYRRRCRTDRRVSDRRNRAACRLHGRLYLLQVIRFAGIGFTACAPNRPAECGMHDRASIEL